MPSNVAQIGVAGAVLTKTDRDFDPTLGWVYVTTWVGNEASIRGLESSFSVAGAKTHSTHDGPQFSLDVRTALPPNGTDEIPLDKWEFQTDFVQDPFWSGPKIIQAASNAAAVGQTADDVIKQWQIDFKDASDAKKLPSETGFADDKLHLYVANIIRGQDSIEVERPILTRMRTISVYYAGQVQLDAVPKVYTTDSLISLFAIPSAIASRLPPDPAFTPDYKVWGWKRRRDTSEFILAIDKVQEQKDFVFAAWDSFSYDII